MKRGEWEGKWGIGDSYKAEEIGKVSETIGSRLWREIPPLSLVKNN